MPVIEVLHPADAIYTEHREIVAVRAHMSDHARTAISSLRAMYPGRDTVLAEVLEGLRVDLMRESERAAKERRTARPE